MNIRSKLFVAVMCLTAAASSLMAQHEETVYESAAQLAQSAPSIFNTAPTRSQALGNLSQIAVYVSEHSGYSNDEKSTLRSAAISTIQRSGRYRVVERSSVISEELAKQASGAVDDDQITRFGRQSGAQLICVVDMTHLRNRREPVYCTNNDGKRYVCNYTNHKDYQVSARMIDVETAEVLAISVVEADITSGPMMTNAVNMAVSDMLGKVQTATADNLPKMATYITGGEARRRRNQRQDNALYSWTLEALFTRSRINRTFKVVERSEAFTLQIDREQTVQRSGAVDDNQIARLGRQYGVQYVLIVNMDYAGNTYNITGRVVNVETATIESASQPRHTDSNLIGLRSIAIQTVEDMIKREITEEEIQAERRILAKEAEAYRTAWIGMFTIGAGGSALLNEFVKTMDENDLAYQVFKDRKSGFNFHIGAEFYKRNLRFIRFGPEWDIGSIGMDKEPIRNVYSNIVEDNEDKIRGGTFWRLGGYVKLTPLDYIYAKGGLGYAERSGYSFKTQVGWNDKQKHRGGTVGGLAYTLGGGINIPIQTDNMKKNDEILAVFVEGNYHTIPLSGGDSNYLTIQGGIRWGVRLTERYQYVAQEM